MVNELWSAILSEWFAWATQIGALFEFGFVAGSTDSAIKWLAWQTVITLGGWCRALSSHVMLQLIEIQMLETDCVHSFGFFTSGITGITIAP